MHELPWITSFGSRARRFANNFHEWRWQIASRVTQKSLFTVTNVLFYFLHAISSPEHSIPPKKLSISDFAVVAKDSLFYLVLWRHHSWSVTSRECRSIALWRHIRRLFLHAQIGAKAIFTIGIDTNIEVIVVSLTTWEAYHSPRAKPEGCGELPRSLMRQQWPKLRYQFLFYHDETKSIMNKQILSI